MALCTLIHRICTSHLLFPKYKRRTFGVTFRPLFSKVFNTCFIVCLFSSSLWGFDKNSSYRLADITLSTLVKIYEGKRFENNIKATIRWKQEAFIPQRPILYNSRGQESLNKASGITCTRVEKFVVGNIIFFCPVEKQRNKGQQEKLPRGDETNFPSMTLIFRRKQS